MSGLRTVTQALEDAAASRSTGLRFVEESNESAVFYDHGSIEKMSGRYAASMQAHGVKKGDRVALILPDNADFVFAFLGAMRAGAIPVPIYPPTGLGKLAGYLENTLHIASRSGAKLLVTSADVRRVLGTVQEKAPALEQIVDVEPMRTSTETFRPAKVELSDVAFIQFTSGSTTRPKGVTLTHENLAANVRCIVDLGLGGAADREGRPDVGVSWLPLYHDMGLIGFTIAPLYQRTNVTLMPPMLFLKRPAKWLEAISRHKGTVSFGPNFAYALCVKRIKDSDVAGLDLSSWRVAGCGAEPIRAENLRAFAERFKSIGFDERAFVCCYGMAESTLAISFSEICRGVRADAVEGETLWSDGKAVPVEAGRDEEGAGVSRVVECGGAFEGHEIAVFAPDDAAGVHRLAEREVGEVRIKGPSVMKGYWDDEELTNQAFAGGWLRTGDLGYLAGGKVHICGRSKEVIIVNGRNYYPQDLEWQASKVEGVRKGNVVAFGTMKPHGDRERVVLVFETSAPDEARDQLRGEVRRVVQQGLGLTADDVVAVGAGVLPKTSSGKLQRAQTRKLYEMGELLARTSTREVDHLAVMKEFAKSQVGFFRHRLFGARSDD